MKYKNLIFDMGNVILDFSPDYLLSKYTDDLEIIHTLKCELFYSGLWQKMDNGDVTLEEMYKTVSKKVPNYMHSILSTYLENWSFNLVINPTMEAFIKGIKEKGFGIYLCSNAPSFFTDLIEFYPILKIFDGIVFSGDIGFSKPNPEIYEYLLDTYELIAEECLFIDDLSSNIHGAYRVGIDGYQYNGNFQLFQDYLKNIKAI